MNFVLTSILRTLTDAKPPFEEKAMSIVKKASAHWEGDLKTGLGSISTETGVLREAPYGFKARFGVGAA